MTTGPPGARWAAMLLVFMTGTAAANDASDAGRRLYREGLLPSGAPLRATVEHDVELSGARAACIQCHRRSGYGGMEGTSVVPPVVAGALFPNARVAPGARPGYDPVSLKRALRDGVHHSGRPLSTLMPRYVLNDADADALIAYLWTLAAEPPPGVDDSTLHIATVITADVPERQRQALLGVFNAYLRSRNAEIRAAANGKRRRAIIGHGRAYQSDLTWQLHVWELHGSPAQWPQQMERYYRAQSVFAVLGGVGRGPWREVQATCEHLEVPCIFPNVDYVEAPDDDFYTLYLTSGVAQEADVLARWLRLGPGAAVRRVVQVYRRGDSGELAAARLRRALAGVTGVALVDGPWNGASRESRPLSADTADTLWVLWLRDADARRYTEGNPPPAHVVISDGLLQDAAHALPAAWRPHTQVLSLRETPDAWQDQRRHLAAWLRSQQLDETDVRIQSNTYLTLTLVARALDHMRANYSRDNLVERIEHLVQTVSWQSIHPRLSLGPGQRVASPGGAVRPLMVDGVVAVDGG